MINLRSVIKLRYFYDKQIRSYIIRPNSTKLCPLVAIHKGKWFDQKCYSNKTSLQIISNKVLPENKDIALRDRSLDDIQKDIVPQLVDEALYTEDILPSEKQYRRHIVLEDKIGSSQSFAEIVYLFDTFKLDIIGEHYASAFYAIQNMVKNRQILNTEDLLQHPDFERFCRNAYKETPKLEVLENITILSTLLSCNVDINSIFTQRIMQILRTSLHLFTLKDFALLHGILKEYSNNSSPLSEALHYASALQLQRILQNDFINPDDLAENSIQIIYLLESINDNSSIAYVLKELSILQNISIHNEYQIIMNLSGSPIMNSISGDEPENVIIRFFIKNFIESLNNSDVKQSITDEMRNNLLIQLAKLDEKNFQHFGCEYASILDQIISVEINKPNSSLKDAAYFAQMVNITKYIPVKFIDYLCKILKEKSTEIKELSLEEKLHFISILIQSPYDEKLIFTLREILDLLLKDKWTPGEVSLEIECEILCSLIRLGHHFPKWLLNNVFLSPSLSKPLLKKNKNYPINDSILNYLNLLLLHSETEHESQLKTIIDEYSTSCKEIKRICVVTPLKETLKKAFKNEFISNIYYKDIFIDHLLGFDETTGKVINIQNIINNTETTVCPQNIKLIAFIELYSNMIIGPTNTKFKIPVDPWTRTNLLSSLGFKTVCISSGLLNRLDLMERTYIVKRRIKDIVK